MYKKLDLLMIALFLKQFLTGYLSSCIPDAASHFAPYFTYRLYLGKKAHLCVCVSFLYIKLLYTGRFVCVAFALTFLH